MFLFHFHTKFLHDQNTYFSNKAYVEFLLSFNSVLIYLGRPYTLSLIICQFVLSVLVVGVRYSISLKALVQCIPVAWVADRSLLRDGITTCIYSIIVLLVIRARCLLHFLFGTITVSSKTYEIVIARCPWALGLEVKQLVYVKDIGLLVCNKILQTLDINTFKTS